jgi:rhodanese-related sulfurtransferase
MSHPNESHSLEVDVQTVKSWQTSRQDWILIDCREPAEYETASIEGAVLMPMSQWQDVSAKLSEHQDKHLVVHCHHGGRSLRVVHWLRANGFPSAQSMAGGIDDWSLQIDPSVPRY